MSGEDHPGVSNPWPVASVTRIRHALPVSADIMQSLTALESSIKAAIAKARDDGLPQGLLSSLLSAYALEETQKILAGGSAA